MKKSPPQSKSEHRPIFEELERRLLLSADVPGLLADPSLGEHDFPEPNVRTDVLAAQDSTGESDQRVLKELVFVDAGLDDAQQLVDDLRAQRPDARDFDVVLLDPGRDGIYQITDVLDDYQNLGAVHILSHGAEATLQLGSATLDEGSLASYENAIASWGDALSEDADLLFYGCDLAGGENGQSFVQSLAKLTDADLAASTDLTGSALLGGDWDLEYASGSVEASVAISTHAQQAWADVLAISVDNTTSASVDGGSSLTWSHTVNSGSDGILIVNVSLRAADGAVTSVTYGGTALTLLGSEENSSGGQLRTEMWYLKAPAAGAANVEITMDASMTFSGGATNFFGVDQTTPTGTYVGASSGGHTPSVTVASAAGEIVIDGVAKKGINTGTVGASQTERYREEIGGGGSAVWGASSTEAGATSVTMSWDLVASGAGEWAAGAVSLKPAAPGVNFQEGLNGYSGTEDTELFGQTPDTDLGAQESISIDLSTSGFESQGLIRFDNLFGPGVGQIPFGSTITSASLDVTASGTASSTTNITLHRMFSSWTESSTWNTLTGGVQRDNVEASSIIDSRLPDASISGAVTFSGLENTVQDWANGATNNGWAIISDDSDGWDFRSSEYLAVVGERPVLNITYSANTAPTAANDSYSVNEDATLDVDWWDTNWTRRQVLTFDNSGQAQDLDDFAVLVVLNPGNITYAQTQDQGQDLRFFDADGTALDYEIEEWNESGNSYVWVRVPRIDASSTTDSITMYYGNATAAAGQDADATWSSEYRAVYHLNEDPATTGGVVAESTTNDFDGINQGSVDIAGRIGGAEDFDGIDDFIDLVGGSFIDGAARVTGSVWVNPDDISAGTTPFYGLSVDSGGGVSRLAIERVGDEIQVIARSDDGESGQAVVTSTLDLVPGTWYHVTAVVDYSTDSIQVFVDGVLEPTTGTVSFSLPTAAITPSSEAALGSGDDGGPGYFDGQLDEARVEIGARSIEWIRAQYLSMTNASFVGFGVEEVAPADEGAVGNDSDAENDHLTATLVSGPSNAASFSFNPDGTFQYTPTPGWSGVDSFDYQLNDGGLDSNVATVTLTVNALPDPPTAFDDSFTTDQDTVLNSNDLWWDNSWTARRQIVFDNLAQTETLSDFVVLVTLDSNTIDYANVQDAGEDLRFIDHTGAVLDYEIEEWNEAGTSYVWVKVPTIDGSSDTDFMYMYYGNGLASAQLPVDVWSSSYRAIYHLDEDPLLTAGAIQDSSGNGFGGTNVGSTDIGGKIANAEDFDGSNDRIDLGANQSFLDGVSGATLSAWIRPDTLVGNGDILGASVNGGSPDASRAGIGRIGNNIQVVARTQDDGSDTHILVTTSGPLTAGQWHHVTAVIDYAGNTIAVYVDGIAQPLSGGPVLFSATMTDATPSSAAAIGSNESGANTYFDGVIDEARISDAARSADWVAAQYASMNGQFVTISPEQTAAGVLQNDLDPDYDTLTATNLDLTGTLGLVVLNGDGSFTYDPNGAFDYLADGESAVDTFKYDADDGNGGLDTATVSITVTGKNDAPITDDVAAGGLEDATSIAVTITGDDVDTTGTVTDFRLSSLPADGTLYTDVGLTILAATGVDYTATGEALTLYFVPDPDWNGVTTFQYVAKDNLGAFDLTAATATLTVTAVNDAPITDDVAAGGLEDATSIAVTITGSDVDGTVTDFRLSSLPADGTLYTDVGLTILAATGVDYTATGEALTLYFVPDPDWNGVTTFQYVAKDNLGAFDLTAATATITVTAVNDAPVTDDVAAGGLEDATSIAVTITGSDLEGTVTDFRLSSLPADGTLYTDVALTILAATGVDYTATGEALTLYFVPDPDWNGVTTFQYVAKDNLGAFDLTAATATITVTAVNDAPITDDVAAGGLEDATSIAVTITGSDVDGTVTDFRLSSLPADGTLYTDVGLTILAATGVDYTATGEALTLYFVPDPDWNGVTTFQYVAKDDLGAFDLTAATATITVTAVNDAPVTDDVAAGGLEDATSIAVTITGSDLEGTVTDFRLSSLPADGTLYTDVGLTILAATGVDYTGEALTLYFVPDPDWNGVTTFQYVAKDNLGAFDLTAATATITVTAVNDAPITDDVAAGGLEDATSIAVTITGSDLEGTVTDFRLSSLPADGTLYTDIGLTILAATGVDYTATGEALTLYFVPDPDWNGVTTFQYVAKDNLGAFDLTAATATITVTAVNDAPVTDDVAAGGLEDATSIAVTITGSDLEGTVTDFRLSSLPADGTLYTDIGLTILAATGVDYTATGEALTLYFVPDPDWNGVTTFQYVAKDNLGAFDLTAATATITVTAVNDAPVTDDVAAGGLEDATSIAVTITGSDLEGTVTDFRLSSLPADGTLYTNVAFTVLAATGIDYTATGEALTLYFVPDPDWNGVTTFQYVAKDNLGALDLTPATATITVTAVNDAPVTNNAVAGGLEDATSITVTITGSDLEGTVTDFRLSSLPADGTLYTNVGLTVLAATGIDYTATGEALTLYFVPDPDWNGVTTFQYVAKDNLGALDLTPATATITVTAVNDAPVTDDVAAGGLEDATSIAVTITGSDLEGTVTDFRLSSLPADGTLYTDVGLTILAATGVDYTATGEALTLYFVPDPDWNGVTTFQYVAKDNLGAFDLTAATATITVTAVNDAPVTDDVAAGGLEDATSIAVTITGSDLEGTVTDFRLSSLPADGTLYTNVGLTVLAATGIDYTATGEALTLYFVPDPDWNGVTTFQYVAKDNLGALDLTPATATLTVTAVNDAPVTNNAVAGGLEDATSITVTITGSDLEGTVTDFRLSSLPADGTLYTDVGLTILAATGVDYTATGEALTLYFVPDPDWNGVTTFQYVAKDNLGAFDLTAATATITVTAVNDAPVTNNAVAGGLEDATSIAVTITGSDLEGTVTDFRLSSLPADGTLYTDVGLTILAATGVDYTATGEALTLYFVPDPDWNGVTTFQYVAKDDLGALDLTPATATLTVTAVNDAPVTDDVAAGGLEDATSIAVTITGSDLEGTVTDFRLSSLPADGTLYTDIGLTILAATGVDYTATGEALTLYFVPDPDWNGVTTFQYVAKDNLGAFDLTAATATITVTAINDAPVTDDVAAAGLEDATSIAVTITGSDLEGTVTDFRLSSLPADGTLYTDVGLTILAATGVDYTATGEALTLYFVPDPDWNGVTTFQYVAKDNLGAFDLTAATATLTVTAVNDAPITDDVAAGGLEDATSIAVTITGSDVDGTVTDFRLSSLPADGTLYTDIGLTILAATGVDYTATGEALTLYFVPDPDWNGVTTFQYVAKDNLGAFDLTAATATITVTAVNDAPVTDDVAAGGLEDATSIAVTITGSDLEGTVTDFRLSSLPADGTLYTDVGLTILAATGVDYTATGEALTLYFVPDPDWNGVTTFQYVAKDNLGAFDLTAATATITVTAVNDAPVTDDVAAGGLEDATSIAVTITGSDLEGTVTDFRLSSLPADGTLYTDVGLTILAATGVDYTATGEALTLYFVPDPDWNGVTTFQYVAKDNLGAFDLTAATATITVTAVNDAPTTNDSVAAGLEDATSIAVTITGSDVDGSVTDFRLSSLPADGTLYTDIGLTILAATGVDYTATGEALTLYFVPDPDWNGVTTFQYVAKDDLGALDLTPATATITVTAVNDAPTTNDSVAAGLEDDTSIAVTITGSDVDGSVTDFQLSSLPADGTLYTDVGLTILAATGVDYTATGEALTLYFVPDPDWNGVTTFQYVAKDDLGALDLTPATATITVTAVNDAPTTNDSVAAGLEDDTSIAVTITGSDVDGTVTDFQLSSLPADGTLYTDVGLTILATTGIDYTATGEALTLYFVPDPDWNGVTTFQCVAKDNLGAFDLTAATATITVTAVNDAPVTDDVAAAGLEDATSIAVTITGSDLEGTVTDFRLSSLPADGTLYTDIGLTILAATGVDYTATGEALTLYFVPDPDWNGVTTFQYVAKDDLGALDLTAATATLTVTAVNDAPVTNNAVAGGLEDATSIAVTITGSDVDGSVTDFQLSSLPADGTLYTDVGLTILAATGVDYTATGEALTLYFVPDPDWNGVTTFQYVAKDDLGALDLTPATATITVTAVNDAPTTNDAVAAGFEDDASITVTITGSDVDGTVTDFRLSSLPADGTLYTDVGLTILAATGIDYTATGEALTLYFVPDPDWTGVTTFQYVAKDDLGALDLTPATATITVTAVNDAPTTNDAVAAGFEDDASITVTITGSDVDGTVTDFRLSSLPADGTLYTDVGLTILAATGIDYTATGEALTLYFVPDPDWTGVTTFQYVAKDDLGAFDLTPATATITVTAVNDAPTTNDSVAAGLEDDTSIAVTITGSDVDGTVTDFRISSLPADGTLYTDIGLTILAATGVDYTATGEALTLYFVPDPDWNGVTTFQYVAKDDLGALDLTPATATITVTAVNDAPVVNDQSFAIDEHLPFGSSGGLVAASDIDAGASWTYAITGGNTGNAFMINPTTGEITVNDPTAVDFETNQPFSLTVQVTDNGTPGLTDIATITVNLNDINEAPVVSDQSFGVPEDAANGASVATVTAADVDAGDSVTYAITAGNATGAFALDPNTGEISIADATQLDFDTTPSFTLTVQVTDSGSPGLTDTATVTVNVSNVSDLPADEELDPEEEEPPDEEEEASTEEESDPEETQESEPTPDPAEGTVGVRGFDPEVEEEPSGGDGIVASRTSSASGFRVAHALDEESSDRNHRDGTTRDSRSAVERVAFRNEQIARSLDLAADHIASDAADEAAEHASTIAIIEGSGLAISTGLLALAARASSLVAVALSSLPAWRRIDPLAVLSLTEEQRKKREDELRAAEREEDRQSEALNRLLARSETGAEPGR